MLAIRRATLDDLEPMTSLYTAAWREGFRHMFGASTFVRDDFTSERAHECRSVLHDEHTDTFIAEIDGILAGFAAAQIVRSGADLDDIWVHPSAWGSGAAIALVSAIEEETRAVGATRITAWVPEDSPSGRRFFDKLGWRTTGAVEPLRMYPNQPNQLFEYERLLAVIDMTRGMPRPGFATAG